ncbi:MAG: hypothetical protein KAY47_00350 [Prevotella sp.]|nr:hypothetical protein [Prevotella sp.]
MIERIVNYDKLPDRGKITSDGEHIAKHKGGCDGRCYVFYDENTRYRVECEKCGTAARFKTYSMDNAIRTWNSRKCSEGEEPVYYIGVDLANGPDMTGGI